MNAITIENNALYANGVQIQELPKLAKDAIVRVWAVPAEYVESGYYVDIQPVGAIPSIPACDQGQASFLAMLDLKSSEDALASAARYERLAQANLAAESLMADTKNTYPLSEMLSWPQQVKEAEDLINNPESTNTPLITALAESRGITREDLATRILQKTEHYGVATGAIFGARQRIEDMLEAAETHADVLAVPSLMDMLSGALQ